MRPLPPETRAAIIAALQEGQLYSEICATHNISKNAVSKIAIKADLRRNTRRAFKLTEAQAADAVARYVAGEKAPAIAATYGVSRDLVWDSLRRAGVPARDHSAARVVHSLRHDAFDAITPDAAYWCGFIFTDGTISRRKNQTPEVAVVLQKRDREHLVKLREFLGSTHAITAVAPHKITIDRGFGQGTGAFRYSVRSRQLADRLTALGRYGPAVDPELAASRDFWRGCIDGDGTVGISCNIAQVKLVGSNWLLGAYAGFLGNIGRRPLNVRPARSIFVVSTGSTAEKVVDWLYTGASTVLDRKAVSAAEVLVARGQRLAAA